MVVLEEERRGYSDYRVLAQLGFGLAGFGLAWLGCDNDKNLVDTGQPFQPTDDYLENFLYTLSTHI